MSIKRILVALDVPTLSEALGLVEQLKGKVKDQWGKLTDDDLDRIGGNYERFEGTLQERYGWKKEEARRELANWLAAKR